MCFGPMAIPPGIEPAPKFHSRCVPENWYERTCEACDQPLKIHVDWDDVPTVHRRCETQEWYEKQCKYCNATLKVHVDWETPPDAHEECKPSKSVDVPISAPAITNPDPTPQVVLAPVCEVDITTELVGFVGTNGNGSKEAAFCAEPEIETPTESESEAEFEPGAGIGVTIETPAASEASPLNGSEIEIATESEPAIPVERNGSVERDTEIADTPWERFNAEMSELTQTIQKPLENENRHAHKCAECGEYVVRFDGTMAEAHSLCQACRNDALLISGAIGAFRKRFPGDLNVVVETKTHVITEKIAVVSVVETDDVVAEVKLCDDGIFSSERTAVAYDPKTQEPFSKTVFGQTGFFSALRTTDTFDGDGKLIEHTRPGKGLPLAASVESKDAHVIQIAKNRFFLKQN